MGLKEIAEQLIAARAMEEGLVRGEEKGIEKGEEKQKRIFVINLIQSTDFSDEKIATLADVTIALVQQLRTDLKE